MEGFERKGVWLIVLKIAERDQNRRTKQRS